MRFKPSGPDMNSIRNGWQISSVSARAVQGCPGGCSASCASDASVVVNNQLQQDTALGLLPGQIQPFTQLTSGASVNRPKGLQRIDWDPKTRRCKAVWANRDISIPNGIPSMSASTRQIFGIGSRTINGVDTWTLESVDFATGLSRYHLAATPYPTDNSFYAATTIGPDNSVWTGTFGGVTRYQDCRTGETCGRRPSPIAPVPVPAP